MASNDDDDVGYELSASDVDLLKAIARDWRSYKRELIPQPFGPLPTAVPTQLGVVVDAIAPNESGDVQVWRGDAGSEEATDDDPVTAWDWLGDGASAGSQVFLFRHRPNGALYFCHSGEIMIAFAPSSIAGASGDISSGGGLTPGSGNVKRCHFDSGTWKKISDDTLTAYNISEQTVSANVPLVCEYIGGQWIINFEACPGA